MKECEFCDNEESVLDAFGFFLLELESETYAVMFYIPYGEEKYRVNHCPVCGKKIRDKRIKIDI
jgi:hypothetical protein